MPLKLHYRTFKFRQGLTFTRRQVPIHDGAQVCVEFVQTLERLARLFGKLTCVDLIRSNDSIFLCTHCQKQFHTDRRSGHHGAARPVN